ncbi:MAG: hypothetical protein SCK28_05310 [Bacillota bacterium]|nr:hypothetical protein [Bacillota bacterium]
MQINRIYSSDPKEWEKAAEFLVNFALKLLEKEKISKEPELIELLRSDEK